MSRPWTVTLSIQDDKGKKSPLRYHYHGEADLSDVYWHVTQVLLALDFCIDGAVTEVSIVRPLDILLPPPAALAEADREEKALFALRTVHARAWSHAWPTWGRYYTRLQQATDKEARRPDADNPAVQLLKNLYTGARVLGHPYNPCDARGDELAGFTHKTAFVWRKT